MEKLVNAVIRLCLRHSKLIAISAVVVFFVSLAAATRISFDPDLLNLIPQNNRQVNDFRKVLRELGTLDNHVVVMTIPAGREVEDYEPLISSIAAGYADSARIEHVNYRIPNPLELVDVILPRALLFLTPQELDLVAKKLSDEGIRESVARNRAMLQTPQAMAMKRVVQYDPFNLLPIFLDKFKAAGGGFQLDAASGYYLSADHTTLLIFAKPKRAAQDVPFAKELLAEGAVIEARAVADFQKSAPSGTPIPLIEHTGGYQIAVGDADLIRQDVIINILSSFFGVLVLFVYAFRRMASIAYAALPMILGLAMTFGVAGLVYGQLSSASAGFAALLAGLGIDFVMVIYGRYVDERNRGEAMTPALVLALRSTLPGVIIAATTTAATFYAFLATDFRGMTQLGMLTGTGILFFLVAIALLLPSLIVINEGRLNRRRAPRMFHHSFGSGHIVDAALRSPRATIAIWAVFIVICGALATRVRFSDNVQDLRSKGNVGVANQEKLTKKFGQSFEFMMYVTEGRTMDEAVDKTRVAAGKFDPLVADGTIASYQSISTFLPPRDSQLAVISTLNAGRGDAFNIGRIDRTFRASLAANGFRPDAFDSYMTTFAQTLSPQEPISLASIGSAELQDFSSRFVKRTGDHWISVMYLYPQGGKWPRDVPHQLTAVADQHPGDILTGINRVSGTLRKIVRADAIRSTSVGLAVVFVLILFAFRSLKKTLLVFIPFIAGTVAMLGLMPLLGLEFNFMNVFIAVMVIGVATDYGLYMLQRYDEDPSHFPHAAHETGKSVVMAALTTIVGYGSFALSNYPGLRSIGYASFFAIFFSALAAITLLPAMLVAGHKTTTDGETGVMDVPESDAHQLP